MKKRPTRGDFCLTFHAAAMGLQMYGSLARQADQYDTFIRFNFDYRHDASLLNACPAMFISENISEEVYTKKQMRRLRFFGSFELFLSLSN